MFNKIRDYLISNFNHKIDIIVHTDQFELKDSFGNSYTTKTFLHVDEKGLVQSVGIENISTTDFKKIDIFKETARFDIACSILKYAITEMLKNSKALVRPKIYFHNVNELSEIYFYDPRNSDRSFVRKKFFTELGLASGGRESFIVS